MPTFKGEPGKPDLTFDEPGAPQPGDDADPFEELSGAGSDPLVQEFSGYRVMPHPHTGKPTRFTRASSFAVSDETILTEWKIAMAVLGVTKNRDLYALGNSEEMPDAPMEMRDKGWWMPWAKLGHKAMDRIGADTGAHLGTAFHAWREQYEAGKITIKQIPREWRAHMEKFAEMHAASQLTYDPRYVERLGVNLKLHNGVCGRLDNLRSLSDSQLIVDDTKTGKEAPRGLDEIGIQLGIYANFDYLWEPEHPYAKHGWIPMPEANKYVATVTWVPINDPSRGRIIPIDIARGWQAAQVSAWLKGYWNQAKRKTNGLELNLAVLLDIQSLVSDKFVMAERINLCQTLGELSTVVLELVNGDVFSPALERLAYERKMQIRSDNNG